VFSPTYSAWREQVRLCLRKTSRKILSGIAFSILLSRTSVLVRPLRQSGTFYAVLTTRSFEAGFLKSSATVFSISRESASSDTVRAKDIAPTSALKVKIACHLVARASRAAHKFRHRPKSFQTAPLPISLQAGPVG
jgi:hypothetical protein